MKTFKNILRILHSAASGWVCLAVSVLLCSGCQDLQSGPEDAVRDKQGTSIERIRISTLTGFEADPTRPEAVQLKVFVELLDSDDSQVQNSCVFRFELYEFKPLSPDPRGRRLTIWPDQDLLSDQSNNAHWKEYLKGYEFSLPVGFIPGPAPQYVLEATCQIDQKRLTDLLRLSP